MRYLLPLILILTAYSCKIKDKTLETDKVRETTFIKVQDTLLRGFDLKPIPIDVNFLKEYDTIKVTDPGTLAELKIWKNKYGELEAECEQKDQLIQKVKVEKDKEKSTEKVKEVTKTLYKYDKWTFIPWGIIALFLLWKFARGRIFP